MLTYLRTGQRGRFIVNIPNLGQVDNLPRQVVVECQADLGAGGVEPISVGALPSGVLQVLASRVWQQETIVDAAVRGAPNLVVQALLADPMVHSWETARALRDQLLAIHAPYLPQFGGRNLWAEICG
jgi:alpha-galactosidase/6-phospho-beta-glucosidase family protein